MAFFEGKILTSAPDPEAPIMNQQLSLFKNGQVVAQCSFPPQPYDEDLDEEEEEYAIEFNL